MTSDPTPKLSKTPIMEAVKEFGRKIEIKYFSRFVPCKTNTVMTSCLMAISISKIMLPLWVLIGYPILLISTWQNLKRKPYLNVHSNRSHALYLHDIFVIWPRSMDALWISWHIYNILTIAKHFRRFNKVINNMFQQ